MTLPPGQLLRIDAERIAYTEHCMRKHGYAPRQIRERDSELARAVPGRNSPI